MSENLPSVRDICEPRDDVLKGTGDRFTANLSQVVHNEGPEVYKNPVMFFENTYPTEGLLGTIQQVFSRLSQQGTGTPVIKLETSLGGGKTHVLIALYHLAKHGSSVIKKNPFVKDLTFDPVNVAAIVGTDIQTTLWGDLARQLKGEEGYKLVKKNDETQTSPNETQLRQLFGDEKCLILIDEIALYLALASGIPVKKSTLAEQTKVFLQTLTQVADAMDNVSLVITSLSKTDVFGERTQELAEILGDDVRKAKAAAAIQEADRVLSRIGINLTPTKGEEFPAIMRKRLFKSYNRTAALEVCKAYHNSLNSDGVKEYMPKYATEAKYYTFFQEAYPFHPEFIQILRTKTTSISNFNQTRGVLRLLGLVIKYMWDHDIDAPLIHPYHIDFAEAAFTNELISRLDRGEYMAAITADIADNRGTPRATVIDQNFSEPLGTRICTTVFLHSLTGVIVSADVRRGATEAEIQLALHVPGLDPKTVENALRDVEDKCFYLVKHGSMYAFSNEPGLNKIIEEVKTTVEGTHVLRECEKRIETIFGGRKYFDPRLFANSPADVPDDTGKPKLVIPHFNECFTTGGTTKIPDLVERLFHEAGTQGKPRTFANNVLFLVADSEERDKMEVRAREYLALQKLCDDIEEGAPSLQALSKNQRDKLKEKRQEAELFFKVAVILVFKHYFLPTTQKSIDDVQAKRPMRKISARMQDTKVEEWVRTNKSQEETILEFLKEHEAVRTADDKPWAAELVIEKFWPKKTESVTGDEFKKLFYKNPDARLIMSEDLILRTQQEGVKSGHWMVVRDGQLYDKGNASVFSGAFTPQTQIILMGTASARDVVSQFYCDKCGKKKTECQCGQQVCPHCGKTLDECICQKDRICPVCGKPIAVCGGVHGPTTIPPIVDKTLPGIVGELVPLLEDNQVEVVDRIEIRAKGRDDLSRLLLALPQFQGAQVRYDIAATLNEEHRDGNFMQVKYRGDDTGFKTVKPLLMNYASKEQFSSCNLLVTFVWREGIARKDLIAILRDKVAQFTGDSLYSVTVAPREEDT
ncbi:MAG: DUF499 domain-containing protein [Thermoplasmatota archaeon]